LTAHQLRGLHLAAAALWALLLVPTVIWWKNSILWVAGCSLYANVIAHLAAYAGARAEDD
jgi:hypothetical protein